MRVEAWRVADTGLVAAPGPFRRLPGAVRHLRGRGERWPDRVVVELAADELVVTAGDQEVGGWPRAEVRARLVAPGPPTTFVLEVPGTSELLAAAATPEVDALVRALATAAP